MLRGVFRGYASPRKPLPVATVYAELCLTELDPSRKPTGIFPFMSGVKVTPIPSRGAGPSGLGQTT